MLTGSFKNPCLLPTKDVYRPAAAADVVLPICTVLTPSPTVRPPSSITYTVHRDERGKEEEKKSSLYAEPWFIIIFTRRTARQREKVVKREHTTNQSGHIGDNAIYFSLFFLLYYYYIAKGPSG